MCGIFGFVSAKQHDASVVLEGLRLLEYRGYDSWGIAVADGDKVLSQKAVGPITGAHTTLPPGRAALGHTRWATHGAVTEANAHPHVDCSGRLALIHNGIVENHQQLRSLLRHQHEFRSQTDTEVLVHLIEEALDEQPEVATAVLEVFRQVAGLSAIAVLDATSGQVVVAKNGSPLVLGWAEDASYLASDPIALLEHTRRITFVEDGQAAALTVDGIRLYDAATGSAVTPEVRDVNWDTRQAGLDGYAHFMAKEIHEQPRVLRELAKSKTEDVKALGDMIRQAKDVYLIGCGTAHHAAMSGKYMLGELAGRQVTSIFAHETALVYPQLDESSLVIALSQSGETIDVLDAVKEARERGSRVAALVNAEGSSLDRFADLTVLLECGPERCVLATKSYTAKLAILYMTSRYLGNQMELGRREVEEASYRVEAVLDRETVEGQIGQTARQIADEQHMFVLGRNRNYPLALEAALKVKEVSYMHAEGFAAGDLKHGVIALVTYGTPCMVLAPDGAFRREILAAAAEVKARGALTIGLSPTAEEEFDTTLAVSGEASSPFEIAATTQLLAYELALLRGADPDKPRNLAKSVTVK
jgi:glutamine---fructose-6-phosphate transaminase (isomerizing)